MKEVPNRLQCAYCTRIFSKGGECQGKKSTNDIEGCLVFKADEKGCIRNDDLRLPIPLYGEIPMLNVWNDNYTLRGVETEIRIKRIHGLSWNTKRGLLYVHCNCDYYENEYSKNYEEPKDKTKLKVIKGNEE